MRIEKLKSCIIFYNVELIAICIKQQKRLLTRKKLDEKEENLINSYLKFEKLKVEKIENLIEFYNRIIVEIYNNIIYLTIDYANSKYFKTSDYNVKYKISVVDNAYNVKLKKDVKYCRTMRNRIDVNHKHFLKNYSDKIIESLKKKDIKQMILDFIDSDSGFTEHIANDFLEKNKNRITQFYINENVFNEMKRKENKK